VYQPSGELLSVRQRLPHPTVRLVVSQPRHTARLKLLLHSVLSRGFAAVVSDIVVATNQYESVLSTPVG
jgi:hypothetical protein